MSRKDQETYESYSKDSFDNPPEGPVGVHRGNTSLAIRMLPFLVVIIIALLAGILTWGYYSGEFRRINFPWQSKEETSSQVRGSDSSKQEDVKKAQKDKADDKAKQDESEGKAKDDAEQQKAEKNTPAPVAPAQTVNKQTAVHVINGTSINGYAAQKSNALRNAGYANVTPENANGQLPSTTVVRYQNETDKATAEDVAKTLGIAAVEQTPEAPGPVVVILLN
ncbi:cell wall integrity and stress response protein 1 [Bifidobacterium aemilianum]|uniref:Cell wall integrity and stress response protein 1 n=1 Tax=Bifidobacterium aemilianum TaxID=2493120 RepID=A0A366K9I6_9BIFI|nr:LytR C-terminal domain-containing protein [Bifidobacterium aemilianum]RBP98410.1 cell wall integrity and stress response protein 1 [Bifidobacterium aemilianum]